MKIPYQIHTDIIDKYMRELTPAQWKALIILYAHTLWGVWEELDDIAFDINESVEDTVEALIYLRDKVGGIETLVKNDIGYARMAISQDDLDARWWGRIPEFEVWKRKTDDEEEGAVEEPVKDEKTLLMENLRKKYKAIEESNIDLKKMGYIYVIRDKFENQKVYKIGKSKQINSRLRSHFTSNLNLKVITTSYVENYHQVELDLHEKYNEFRVSGEWFKLDINKVKEVKNYLRKVDRSDLIIVERK